MDESAVDGAVGVGRVDAKSRESFRSHLSRRDAGQTAEAWFRASRDRLPLDIGWRPAASLQRLLLYRKSQPRRARRVLERLFRSVGCGCLRLLRFAAVRVDRATRLGVLPCARASKVRRRSSVGRDASNHKDAELLSSVVRHRRRSTRTFGRSSLRTARRRVSSDFGPAQDLDGRAADNLAPPSTRSANRSST